MTESLLVGQYYIVEKLASGGFGDTFIAEDKYSPSRSFRLVKLLRPMDSDPQSYQIIKQFFQKEAALLENVGSSHGQIPTLFAYFENEGQFYLVQEYIQGETLSELVKRQGLQSESTARSILLKLLDVLKYIQEKRIIHRDIKPDNIIIRQNDDMPILIDFGAVKEIMSTVVAAGRSYSSSVIIGTPGFMPPEQAAGRPVFSSDLYAMGLTIIYLLTGKLPLELNTDPLNGEILWRQ